MTLKGTVHAVPRLCQGTAKIDTQEPEIHICTATNDRFFCLAYPFGIKDLMFAMLNILYFYGSIWIYAFIHNYDVIQSMCHFTQGGCKMKFSSTGENDRKPVWFVRNPSKLPVFCSFSWLQAFGAVTTS